MIRILLSLAALGLLASCAQYREPRANCFSFLAATGPMDADDGLVENAPACNCRVPGGAPRASGRGVVAGLALAAFALGRRRRATNAR